MSARKSTWRIPRLTAYRAADRRTFAIGRNRYYGQVTIGIALHIGTRVLSLVWARPKHPIDWAGGQR